MPDLSQWLAQQTLIQGGLPVLAVALFGALCVGTAKAGLSATATLNVVLMARVFGAKTSVGLVLPLLIAADMMGFWINRHGGSWRRVLPMAPPAMLGVIVGAQLLAVIDNGVARVVIGWIIIGLLAFKLLLDARREALISLTEHRAFTWAMGFTAGTTTMLANAAGPVMAVYLLAQRLPKKEYLGVWSRFFLFINLFKVPFSANLGLISPTSLATNAVLLPGVVAGILLGWWLLTHIPQAAFEWLLFAMTFVAALSLLVG
ncbi:MAG: sulfite exporter TauE/SafE family protein [Acidobacteria bacterium]|nr:sulfite exporter TauE/SafE family protein [Acidobacteriota bacterium]